MNDKKLITIFWLVNELFFRSDITTTSISLPTSTQQTTLPGVVAKLKTKGQPNKCVGFIKSELSQLFTEENLGNGRQTAGKGKHKNCMQENYALSPGRLKIIIGHVRIK